MAGDVDLRAAVSEAIAAATTMLASTRDARSMLGPGDWREIDAVIAELEIKVNRLLDLARAYGIEGI